MYKLNRQTTLLLLIIAIALLYRVTALPWGVPFFLEYHGIFHPDEPKIIQGAYEFPAHIQENRDLRYSTFMHYSLGAMAKISYPIFSLVTDASYYSYVYMLGRVLNLLVAILTLVVIYKLGTLWRNEKIGLGAAFLMAIMPIHAHLSTFATTDVLATFFTTLVGYLTLKYYREDREKIAF